ncbi:MAG: rod shape-determining protein MreC, partial [Polyangiaceae bacterium]
MVPPLKRYRDAVIVAVLLAVPFFVLKANIKSPASQSSTDRAILRISAPIEIGAATVAHGLSDVVCHYAYLVDVKQDNERLAYDNARLRERVHSLEQAQVEN